jgi:tetratricopeptide (TPR) repeat protein
MSEKISEFQAGLKAGEEGRFEDAILHYEKALLSKPEEAVYFNLGSVYFRLKKFDLSKKNLISTLKINPKLTRAHILLAYIYGQEKNFERASIYFRNSLKIDKNNRASVLGLTIALSELGNFKEALDIITAFPGHEKDRTLASLKAGLHLKLGHIQESAREYIALTKESEKFKNFSDHLADARKNQDEETALMFAGIEDKIKDRTGKVKELLLKKKESGEIQPTKEDLKDMVDLSFLHLFNGDPEKAIKLLMEAKRIKGEPSGSGH